MAGKNKNKFQLTMMYLFRVFGNKLDAAFPKLYVLWMCDKWFSEYKIDWKAKLEIVDAILLYWSRDCPYEGPAGSLSYVVDTIVDMFYVPGVVITPGMAFDEAMDTLRFLQPEISFELLSGLEEECALCISEPQEEKEEL